MSNPKTLDEIAERVTDEIHTPGRHKRKPNGATLCTIRAALDEAVAEERKALFASHGPCHGPEDCTGMREAVTEERRAVRELVMLGVCSRCSHEPCERMRSFLAALDAREKEGA